MQVFDENDVQLVDVAIPSTGNGKYVDVPILEPNVKSILVDLFGSGAVDDIVFDICDICPGGCSK